MMVENDRTFSEFKWEFSTPRPAADQSDMERTCPAVNKLWSEEDFDALRPMMSERLWEALRHDLFFVA